MKKKPTKKTIDPFTLTPCTDVELEELKKEYIKSYGKEYVERMWAIAFNTK